MTPQATSWPDNAPLTDAERDKTSSEFIESQMALTAPRHILAQLRDVMAGGEDARDKLNRVVTLVAREMKADVCSCYVMRPGGMLQMLASTLSLKKDAPPVRVRVGERRVGLVAQTAAPVVRTVSGRRYQAFCGVPVLRNGSVRGVLVIRNRLARNYSDDVVDILQTVAMVLAEMMTAGGIMPHFSTLPAAGKVVQAAQVEAVSLGRGQGLGTAVVYDPVVTVRDVVSEDVDTQYRRLDRALSDMRDAVAGMLARHESFRGTETYAILEAYQMLAQDESWIGKIRAAMDNGLVAEAAVQHVQNETRARMGQMADGYIRERLADLEDVSHRLLTHLVQREQEAASAPDAVQDIVLVAKTLGPAVLMDYDRNRLKGIIVEQGGRSNHVSIVARSLGIPIVGQCEGICGMIRDGDRLIVDGDNGAVYINPTDYVLGLYRKNIQTRARRSMFSGAVPRKRSVTKDGVAVSVMINAGLSAEVDGVFAAGADGVGLFRTELSFMGLRRYPSVRKQAGIYETIFNKSGGRPVVFRTLDIGGDKPLPYFKPPVPEENPALGWRAMRIAVDRPVVLRSQFRALLLAARGRDLKIMLPFVSEVAEVDHARDILEDEISRMRRRGVPVAAHIPLGVMIEVPALVWHLDAVLESADFVSVGTNDLMQYLFAADRSNYTIRNRYDTLSPAMIRVLQHIVQQCKQAGKPAGVCGEMAAHPLEAMVLLALGYDSLSVPAQAVAGLREMVPTLDAGRLLSYLEECMGSHAHSLRQRLMDYAQDHEVNIVETV